jgi:type I restriction enzyme S subunit
MKAERFLEKFDQIVTDPSGVDKLRALIVSLAVRGKLSEPDPKDVPVNALKEQLAESKFRRMPHCLSAWANGLAAVPSPRPFEIPHHWAWVALSDIGSVSGGMTPSKTRADYWNGDINWFSPKDIKSDELVNSELKITSEAVSATGLQLYPPGCLFMVARSGILKRVFPVAINRVHATANQDLKVLTPFVPGLERYVQIMLRGMTDFILASLVKTGMTVQSLKYQEFEIQPFPIPPLAEQKRIVAKVDELMVLCDRLETQLRERDTRHSVLARASMARFYEAPTSRNLNLIFHGSYTVAPAEVRKAILALAFHGKLLPRNANDAPVAGLYGAIQFERGLVRTSRVIRRQETSPVTPSEEPFRIPNNWMWVRLGDIGDWGSGSTPSRASRELYGGGVTWLKSGELNDNRKLSTSEETVTETALRIGAFRRNQAGDVLIAMYGATIGKLAILASPAVTNQAVCGCTPFPGVLNTFLFYYLMSQREQLHDASEGGAQPNISKIKIVRFPFPLAPLAEQHRIVAKVEQLMELADAFESQHVASKEASLRLLSAMLSGLTAAA